MMGPESEAFYSCSVESSWGRYGALLPVIMPRYLAGVAKDAARLDHPALVRVEGLEPREDAEQRRLAGAVGADHADLGAVQEREGDVVEDDLVTVGLAHVPQGEHIVRHGPRA